jgi:hypothetical protein
MPREDSFCPITHTPLRRFFGNEEMTATGLNGPITIAEDLDNLSSMFNPNKEILNGSQRGGIATVNIQDGAINTQKLADKGITNEKLADNTISEEKVQVDFKAPKAVISDRAIADADGQSIKNTYATKAELTAEGDARQISINQTKDYIDTNFYDKQACDEKIVSNTAVQVQLAKNEVANAKMYAQTAEEKAIISIQKSDIATSQATIAVQAKDNAKISETNARASENNSQAFAQSADLSKMQANIYRNETLQARDEFFSQASGLDTKQDKFQTIESYVSVLESGKIYTATLDTNTTFSYSNLQTGKENKIKLYAYIPKDNITINWGNIQGDIPTLTTGYKIFSFEYFPITGKWSVVEVKKGFVNLWIDTYGVGTNAYLDTSGVEISNGGYWCLPFTDIAGNLKITVRCKTSSSYSNSRVCFYDQNQAFISFYTIPNNNVVLTNYTYDIPANAKYVKVSVGTLYR